MTASARISAAEAELKAEAAALELLRLELTESTVTGKPPEAAKMADFANRQKAFIDRRILVEKHKMAGTELPEPFFAAVAEPPAEVKAEAKPVDVPAPSPKLEPVAGLDGKHSAKAAVADVTRAAAPAKSQSSRTSEPPAANRSPVMWVLLALFVAAGAVYLLFVR